MRAKSDVPASSISRAVLSTIGRGHPRFYETSDARLISRLIDGLRSASRPQSQASREEVSYLYLVPKRGRPLLFGIMLDRVEDLYGGDLARPVNELLREKPITYFDAYDTGRRDLTELRSRSR